ncbi:glycosyltransferase [Flavobacteriaceae bacterium]|nr:glycosyltransferase [Flavobacteriaceae bacterium]
MKIAFIIYSLEAGGAERVVTILANFFSKKHDVEIFVFSEGPVFYKLSSKVRIKAIEYKKASKFPFKRLRDSYSRISALKKLLIERNSHVIISFTTVINLYSIIANIFLNRKLIISERVDPKAHKLSPKIVLLRNLLYQLADKLVVQNNAQYQYFIKKIKENKLVIINNPIEKIAPNSSVDDKVHIVNIGRLAEQKNHFALIDAFINANLKCNLYILGDGPKKKHLEEYIIKNNMQNRIHLVGLQKDVYKYLKSDWIFASTSNYEGYPNALIEAMNAGLACVHYDCPSGIGEIIQDEVNGCLIPINQNKIFSSKLKELFNDKTKRTLFGINARNSVQKLQVENIVNKWLEII